MIDNRTISAITPVDDTTSDVRFMVYIGRTRGESAASDPERAPPGPTSSAPRSSGSSARHLHLVAPALLRSAGARRLELAGFTAIRQWAKQFYPDGRAAAPPS